MPGRAIEIAGDAQHVLRRYRRLVQRGEVAILAQAVDRGGPVACSGHIARLRECRAARVVPHGLHIRQVGRGCRQREDGLRVAELRMREIQLRAYRLRNREFARGIVGDRADNLSVDTSAKCTLCG